MYRSSSVEGMQQAEIWTWRVQAWGGLAHWPIGGDHHGHRYFGSQSLI